MIGEGTDYANLVIKDELNVEEYGAAFRKGSDVAAAVDTAFDELKADRYHADPGRQIRPDPGRLIMGEAGVIWSRLTSAFLMNCQLFGLTLLFALPLGLLVSLGSMSPVHTAAGRGQNLCVDHPWHAVDAANHLLLPWPRSDGFASSLGFQHQWPPAGGGGGVCHQLLPAIFPKFTAAVLSLFPLARRKPGRCLA